MTRRTSLFLAASLLLITFAGEAQYRNSARDGIEQPEKVMETVGVKPGMVVGEIGAGHGYFTFWLAKGVGETGKIYANDIDKSALAAIERRREDEKVANIETVLGTVDDPRLPAASLDMVFVVNAFHDLEKPVDLLANLLPSLKPGATVVITEFGDYECGPRAAMGRAVHALVREQRHTTRFVFRHCPSRAHAVGRVAAINSRIASPSSTKSRT